MRFTRFPISDGMLPVRVFMPRLSTLRPRSEQSSGGISPWNLLLYNARISRRVQLASDAGICPWSELSLRLRWMRSVRLPSSGGRTPCRRFPARWSLLRLPSCGGIVPRRPSPGSSSATTRPRRCPRAPHVTPRHRHTGMDRFPHVGSKATGGEPPLVDICVMNAVRARLSLPLATAAVAASHARGHAMASRRHLKETLYSCSEESSEQKHTRPAACRGNFFR
uniref:Uncharacterized protein n=1 Tax=Leersia perrieri TaxID=77586 RepID=A0A0D9VDQ9_9ORYZ